MSQICKTSRKHVSGKNHSRQIVNIVILLIPCIHFLGDYYMSGASHLSSGFAFNYNWTDGEPNIDKTAYKCVI